MTHHFVRTITGDIACSRCHMSGSLLTIYPNCRDPLGLGEAKRRRTGAGATAKPRIVRRMTEETTP